MIQTITNPQALAFYTSFIRHRQVNTDFFQKIPEEDFNFRLTPRSDSIKQSLIHLTDTTRDHVSGITEGELDFGRTYDDLARMLKDETVIKSKLLETFSDSTAKLLEALQLSDIGERLVKVPWSDKPVAALEMIWALQNHEILHTGWNLALMDILEIARFGSLRQMWG